MQAANVSGGGPVPRAPGGAPGAEFTWQDFAQAVLSRWKLGAAIVGTCVAAVLVYLYFATPYYSSTARVRVEPRGAKVVKIEDVAQQDMQSEAMLNTLVREMTARPLMRRVVDTLGLAEREAFYLAEPRAKRGPESATAILRGLVSARLVRDTRLVDLVVEHPDRELARDIAAAFVDAYVAEQLEGRSATARAAGAFLVKQVEEAKDRLEKAERAMQQYQEEQGSVSVEERNNLVLARLKDLTGRQAEVKAERLRLEADSEQLQRIGSDPEKILTVRSVASNARVADLKKVADALDAEISALQQRYKPKHPKMVEAQGRLRQVRESLRQALLEAPKEVASALQAVIETERALEAEAKQVEGMALEVQEKAIRYRVLSRDVDTDRALYTQLLERLKETKVTGELETVDIAVVEPPVVAHTPSRPKPARLLALAVLAGLALSVVLALVLDTLDVSVKTADEAEAEFGLPVLGAIPQSRTIAKGKGLVMVAEPHGIPAEAFRTLRTAVLMLRPEAEQTVCAFTSAVAREGKSVCCANYAVALAQQGFRTLIIDADLRRPMVDALLGLDQSKPGVTEVLLGRATLEETIQPTGVDNLSAITVGMVAPNPAELLGGHAFEKKVLSPLSGSYDRIVLDTAPVNIVSDTLLLAPAVDMMLLVVRAGVTGRRVVAHAVSALAHAGKGLAGLVLNGLPSGRRGSYYYSYQGNTVYGSGSYRGARAGRKGAGAGSGAAVAGG